MSLCVHCGIELPAGDLCHHHVYTNGDDWHVSNRIMCDFFHRHRTLSRLGPVDRVDEQIVGGEDWYV